MNTHNTQKHGDGKMEDRRRGTEKNDTKSVSVVAITNDCMETKKENVKYHSKGKSDLKETPCTSSSNINTEFQMERLLNTSVSLNLGEETKKQPDQFVHKNSSKKIENRQTGKDEKNGYVQCVEEIDDVQEFFLLIVHLVHVFIKLVTRAAHSFKTNEHVEKISKTVVPGWLFSDHFARRTDIDVYAVPENTMNWINSPDILRNILEDQTRRRVYLATEQFRLATFHLQRRSLGNLNIIQLARDGFFYDITGRVVCFDCNHFHSQSRTAGENHHQNCRAHDNTTETIANDYGSYAQMLLTQTEGGIQETGMQDAATSSEARASQFQPASNSHDSERCFVVTSHENSRHFASMPNRNYSDFLVPLNQEDRLGPTCVLDSNPAEDEGYSEAFGHNNRTGTNCARNIIFENSFDENNVANHGNNLSYSELAKPSEESSRRNCVIDRHGISSGRRYPSNHMASRTTATTPNVSTNISSCKYPQFALLHDRKRSFDKSNFSVEKRRKMAEAGLFYTGQGDETLCFKCGNGLKDWSPGDDPFKEHAKHSPECCLSTERYARPVSGTSGSFDNTGKMQSIVAQKTMHGEERRRNIPAVQGQANRRNPVTTRQILASKNANQRTASSTSLNTDQEARHTIMAENESLRASILCCECMERQRNVVLLPCRHFVICNECEEKVKICPSCNTQIVTTYRTNNES